MQVLSLFDGMSCGQIALERAGIPVDIYWASELDKHAIKVTMMNYPKTIQLGDVLNWRNWPVDWSKIDLLIGGSPCQGFSNAGAGLAFDDPRSVLFFTYVEILNHIRKFNHNVKFLMENVKMKKDWLDIISTFLGVHPVFINSALVSAQNRQRYYWVNWNFDQPEDLQITWGDIREHNVENAMYYSEKAFDWIKKHGERKGKTLRIWKNSEKCQMIEKSHHKKYSSQRFFGVLDKNGLRYVTPVECERAQTVPDNYTSCVSDTHRYQMLGNGWTVNVIANVFKGLMK